MRGALAERPAADAEAGAQAGDRHLGEVVDTNALLKHVQRETNRYIDAKLFDLESDLDDLDTRLTQIETALLSPPRAAGEGIAGIARATAGARRRNAYAASGIDGGLCPIL